MEMTLDELTLYLPKNVPQAKAIKHLTVDQKAKVVQFEWQGRRFVVRTSLQTYELKKTSLYVTGTSVLMQQVLTSKTQNQTIIGEIVDKFDEALNSIKGDRQKGLTLLQPIKSTLARMAGTKSKARRSTTM